MFLVVDPARPTAGGMCVFRALCAVPRQKLAGVDAVTVFGFLWQCQTSMLDVCIYPFPFLSTCARNEEIQEKRGASWEHCSYIAAAGRPGWSVYQRPSLAATPLLRALETFLFSLFSLLV